MDPMKHVISTGFVIFMSGMLIAGADDQENRLGEPVIRMTHDQLETVGSAKGTQAVTVNTYSRSAVASYYFNEYVPPLSVPMQWSGNVATCNAGTTSQAYQAASAS